MGGADDSARDSVELGHGARPIGVVARFRLDFGTGTIAEVTAGETELGGKILFESQKRQQLPMRPMMVPKSPTHGA